MAYRGDMSGKFWWFLAGIGAGSVVALLWAPRSGRETRRYISRSVEGAGEYLTEHGQEIMDKGREFAGEAAHLVARGRKLARV
jgi:gas vesicle protein